VNAFNASGSTPLHDAALAGHTPVLNLLLTNGAKINAQDAENRATPLQYAASWGRVEAVRALLKAGADPNLTNKANLSPLDSALANGHEQIVTILKEHGARK
jgi:ankyrin repeat protein